MSHAQSNMPNGRLYLANSRNELIKHWVNIITKKIMPVSFIETETIEKLLKGILFVTDRDTDKNKFILFRILDIDLDDLVLSILHISKNVGYRYSDLVCLNIKSNLKDKNWGHLIWLLTNYKPISYKYFMENNLGIIQLPFINHMYKENNNVKNFIEFFLYNICIPEDMSTIDEIIAIRFHFLNNNSCDAISRRLNLISKDIVLITNKSKEPSEYIGIEQKMIPTLNYLIEEYQKEHQWFLDNISKK